MRILSFIPLSLLVVLVLLVAGPEKASPAMQTDLATPETQAAPSVSAEETSEASSSLITYNNPIISIYRVGTDGSRTDAYVAGCFCAYKGHWGNAESWIKQGGSYPGWYATFDPDHVERNGSHGLYSRIVCDTDVPE